MSQREQAVSEAFVGLADTLVPDYDAIDLLYRLAESCVELLDVDAAGLLLSDQRGNLTPLAATEGARVLELIQIQNDEGPCRDCFYNGAPVSCADLVNDGAARWPGFAPYAVREGFGSVHALPLRLREETIGSLNLLRTATGPLPPEDLRLAQALADVATIAILQERVVRRGEVLAEQLQSALNNRVIIEQAKGVLATRAQIDMDRAFTRLRGYARAHHLRLSDLARDVVDGGSDLDALLHPAAGNPNRASRAAPRRRLDARRPAPPARLGWVVTRGGNPARDRPWRVAGPAVPLTCSSTPATAAARGVVQHRQPAHIPGNRT